MWIDTVACPETFHILGKDADSKWAFAHSDNSICELVEFGGDVDERIETAEVEAER